MFVQQGVARNQKSLIHDSTHARINFVDQTVNGTLALQSSSDESFATIDLKDASDKVSTTLVGLVFPEWSLRYLYALRSTSTLLPDGTLFERHRKYAPMGSALCFPVESCIFWALAVIAGVKAGLTMEEAKADTYVYGDDIIIRPQVFSTLVELFTRCGLKVNIEKSYVSGPFRESCGVDAWKGFLVTPFKIKKDISRRSLDGTLATAVCKYSSTCFALGYRKTGEYLFDLVNKRYPGIVRSDKPIGCLHVVDEELQVRIIAQEVGYSTKSCRSWIKGWVLSYSKKPNSLTGLSRLLMNHYGSWEEHDPSQVVDLRTTKIRKRKVLVEFG